MPFSCCCCCCHIQYFSSYFFLSLSPLYVSLSATGFLCVFSTYFPFLNITNFLFPFQSSLTLLAATTNVSTTASQSVSLSVSVSCECLSVSVSVAVCVSNVVLAKESLETLCFAVSQWQNLHRSLFMFFFFAHISWPCESSFGCVGQRRLFRLIATHQMPISRARPIKSVIWFKLEINQHRLPEHFASALYLYLSGPECTSVRGCS